MNDITAADFALLGCHPRELPQELVLRALLAQVDHYVADEVIELAEHAGVVSRRGWAIVTNEVPPAAVLPPGLVHRTFGDHHAVFWTGFQHEPRVWAGKVDADAPEILAPITKAIAEWGQTEELDPNFVLPAQWILPWCRWPLARRGEMPAAHAQWFAGGCSNVVAGILAVALGRMDKAIVTSIEETHWMFDREDAQ